MGKKAKIIFILVILALAVFASGCVGQSGTTIKSEAEASEKVTNISEDVDKVASTLEDIDSRLG
ncbi:MAG: hypothetical protein HZB67_04700 [Candidatus Aenigmarchaeota archaeon]|nr:hypothetical protein [Candidatus Aenigmarchaeota archaeon]